MNDVELITQQVKLIIFVVVDKQSTARGCMVKLNLVI